MAFFIFIIIILCLQDVKSSINLARGRRTDFSSIHSSMLFLPEFSVDGNTNQVINFCFHTSEVPQASSWLRVDLGQIDQIENITIYYRDEGGFFLRRFMGYEIYISNTSAAANSGELCYSNVGQPTPSTIEAHKCNYLARYATVYKERRNGDALTRNTEGAILEICEFQVYGCPIGQYGNNNCNSRCSGCPQQLCNPTNGLCRERGFCELGFYGNNTCNELCPLNCESFPCNFSYGDCTGCVDGFYGPRCNMTCPTGCLTPTCNFLSGHCTECVEGYYGLRCNMLCSTGCLFRTCAFQSGRCTGDVCFDGFYGVMCDQSCPTNCNTTYCDFQSGTCQGCDADFYGPRCEFPCPENCRTDTCDFLTGQCDACISGYFDNKCDRKCPDGCRDSCNFTDGTCDACTTQRYGPTCAQNCDTCRGNCGSTGVCLLGCIEGWEGQKCDKEVTDNVATIVTVVLVLILIGVIAAAVFVLQRKRWKHQSMERKIIKPEYTNSNHLTIPGANTSFPIPSADTDSYSYEYRVQPDNLYSNLAAMTVDSIVTMITKKLADDCDVIDREFKALPYGPKYPHEASVAEQNVTKNRYKTTYAYDHSRVKLVFENEEHENDYINANYIHGVDRMKTYIATQGPKPNTINDFWQMVWQEDSGKILMLTNLTEHGKRKCNMYWPEEGQPLITKSFELTILEEKHYSFYVIRRIQISSKMMLAKPPKVVVQFHFTNWPDHGTPDSQELIQFQRRVIQWKSPLNGPTVVHCSAGLGRTGTYIGLDALYLYFKKTGLFDIRGYAEAMRKDRMNMIQTTDQYAFLHEVLAESLMVPNTLYSKFEFIDLYSNLGHQSILESMLEEYQVLMKTKPLIDPSEHRTALKEENKDRNTIKDVLAADRNRIFVNKNVDGNDYINAIRVPSYLDGIGYIVTQSPHSTVEHFWSMVKDCNVSTIVVLEEENATWTRQWLPAEDTPLIFKTCRVRNGRRTFAEDGSNVVQSVCMVSDESSQTEMMVSIIRVLDIENDISSSSSVNPFLVALDILSNKVINEDNQLVVMCRKGVAFSGMFCLLSNVRQQLVHDAEVDIFQAARRLQNRRPQFIPTLDQYQFCFKAALKLITMLDVYQNA